jgi:hypothetical protein
MANATDFGALPTNAPVQLVGGMARRWAASRVVRPASPTSYPIAQGGGLLDPIPGKASNEGSILEDGAAHDSDSSLQITLPNSTGFPAYVVFGWATCAMNAYASSELQAVLNNGSFDVEQRLSYRVNDALHIHNYHFGMWAFTASTGTIRLRLRNPSSNQGDGFGVQYDWADDAGITVFEVI